MADQNKDVNLRVRARDYSQKTFKQLTKVYESLIAVQEAQATSADKGEASARDLEATYKRLEDAGRQLLKLKSLSLLFKEQEKALEQASQSALQAKGRYEKLADEYNKTEKATAKQTAALSAAKKASDSAAKAEEKRRVSLSKTREQLEGYGVDVNKAGQNQQQFTAGVNAINAALERQDKALESLEANRAAARGRNEAQRQLEAEAHAINNVINALQRQADQAIATSRGYKTLGRVVNTTSGSYGKLGLQLESVIAPAESARRTLGGLEGDINNVNGRLDELSRTSDTAKTAMRGLAEAQRRLVGIGGLIDQYRKQNAELRTSRNEYNAAKADLLTLSNQLRSAGADYDQLGVRIQAAQQRLNAASQALRNQAEAARRTQAALREAGVQTNKLAQEEERLIASANRSVTAVERLSSAVRRNGQNKQDAAKWTDYFTKSNRESLSMFQRVRGEIIALTTAYVGLQGVINLAGGAVDAYKVRQQTLIKVSSVVGNSQEALGREWEYIVGLADALGLRVEDVAGSYSKFAVAAKEVGISLQETKFIFESTAKAARVFQLSADDTQGVFRALEQILGKGQVYAEELRGQLGERLPAAVALFAKGMGITIAELQKQLEAGSVGADEVINFARAQSDAIAAQLGEATKGLGAAEARLANAQYQFRLAIADAGFIESYTNLLTKLTEFLRSEQGTALAEKLAQVFSAVADAIIWAADNTDTLVAVFSTLAAIKVATWLGGIVGGLVRAGKDVLNISRDLGKLIGVLGKTETASSKARGALGLLAGGFRLLLRAIPIVGAVLLAWDIGKILYDHSTTARAAIDAVADSFRKLPITIEAALKSIPALLEDLSAGPLNKFEQLFRTNARNVIGIWEQLARGIPGVGDALGDAIRDTLTVAEGENRDFFKETNRVWDEAAQKWEQRQRDMVKGDKDKYDAMLQQAKDFSKSVAAVTGVGFPTLGGGGDKGQYNGPLRAPESGFRFTEDPGTGPTPRTRQIRELIAQFEKLQKSADKANKSVRENLARRDLPGRLALVDEEFAPIMAKARGVGGEEGAKLVAQLEKIIALRKETERLEFEGLDSDKRLKQIERLRAKYEELQATIGAKDAQIDPNQTYEGRLAANLEVVNAQYDQLIAKARKIGGDEGAAFEGQFEALRQLNQELVTEQTRLAEIKRLEDQLTAQMNTKKSLIAEVNSLREAGLISEQEAVDRTIQINAQTNFGLSESIRLLEEFALKMQSSLTPEAFARINAEIAAMRAGLTDVTGTFTKMDMTVTQGVLEGMQGSLNSIVTELTQAAVGVQSWSDAFANAGAAVAQFFADFLMKIAQAILQQMILNALANSGWGGIATAAVSMGGKVAAGASHNGGIVGDKSSGTGFQNRGQVPAAWFAGARRYHSGGLPGLRPDEVPTILQKGEQVLSKDDPDNVLNRVAKAGSGGGQGMSARFVLVDDRTKVPEAMNSPEGEQVFLEYITRNALTVKQILG